MDNREKAVLRGIEANSMLHCKDTGDVSQLYYLFDLAKMAPDGIAIECGVYHGGSVATWSAARHKRGPLIAVDDWSSKNEQIFRDTMERYGIEIEIITANGWEAPDLIQGQVAFCFLDDDHSIRGIPRNILVWPDRMMPGGILVFHDYNVAKRNVAVKCIVDCWREEVHWEHLGTVGSTIAFRKPR